MKEKVLGAVRAGIREIVLPKDNEGDLEDIHEDVRKMLIVHPVSELADVLDVALLPKRGNRKGTDAEVGLDPTEGVEEGPVPALPQS